MNAPCVRCGRPTDATVCHPEALSLAETLRTAAGHAEDAEAVLTRQTRYGAGSRGGSGEPLPVDLTAATRYRAVENAIGGWARHVAETTGDPIPPPAWPTLNTTTLAARYLAERVDQLRGWPEAGEAFKELHDACAQLARLVDRPADKELVGRCDCGARLYAHRDQAYVTCAVATCKLRWNVAESRAILLAATRKMLFTASECAHWAAFWTERTQPQIRALITLWVQPNRQGVIRLHGRGWIPNDDYTGDGDEPQGWHTYLLGDVLDLLAQTPRRERKREGAAA